MEKRNDLTFCGDLIFLFSCRRSKTGLALLGGPSCGDARWVMSLGLEAVTADSSASLRNDTKKCADAPKKMCGMTAKIYGMQPKNIAEERRWLVVGDDGLGLMGEVVVEEFVTAVVTVLDFEE